LSAPKCDFDSSSLLNAAKFFNKAVRENIQKLIELSRIGSTHLYTITPDLSRFLHMFLDMTVFPYKLNDKKEVALKCRKQFVDGFKLKKFDTNCGQIYDENIEHLRKSYEDVVTFYCHHLTRLLDFDYLWGNKTALEEGVQLAVRVANDINCKMQWP
jgi:hypothetical protein